MGMLIPKYYLLTQWVNQLWPALRSKIQVCPIDQDFIKQPMPSNSKMVKNVGIKMIFYLPKYDLRSLKILGVLLN